MLFVFPVWNQFLYPLSGRWWPIRFQRIVAVVITNCVHTPGDCTRTPSKWFSSNYPRVVWVASTPSHLLHTSSVPNLHDSPSTLFWWRRKLFVFLRFLSPEIYLYRFGQKSQLFVDFIQTAYWQGTQKKVSIKNQRIVRGFYSNDIYQSVSQGTRQYVMKNSNFWMVGKLCDNNFLNNNGIFHSMTYTMVWIQSLEIRGTSIQKILSGRQ